MACTAEELRKRIESLPVASSGKMQFSPELRCDILEYSNGQQAAGRTASSVANELGMNDWTLNRWHQNARKAPGGAAFVEVAPKRRGRPPKVRTAAIAPPAPAFEVTCPSGFEVRVPARFEARALRELVAVLEGR
jgi:hypothetical protein